MTDTKKQYRIHVTVNSRFGHQSDYLQNENGTEYHVDDLGEARRKALKLTLQMRYPRGDMNAVSYLYTAEEC